VFSLKELIHCVNTVEVDVMVGCNQKTASSKLHSSDNSESCCKLVVVVPFSDKFKEIHERLFIFETNFLRIMHTSQC
jgi:hypothetical protein